MPALHTLHEKQNGRCYYCGGRMLLPDEGAFFHEARITRDHRIPRSKGGGGGSNIVGSCYKCNHQKGDQYEHEFRVSAGWLAKNPRWLQIEVALSRARAERSKRAVAKWDAAQQNEPPRYATKEQEVYAHWLAAPAGGERARLYIELCKMRGVTVAPLLLQIASAA